LVPGAAAREGFDDGAELSVVFVSIGSGLRFVNFGMDHHDVAGLRVL
jgi:hypothetical protein